jgi:hypothetical protein
MTHNYEAGGSGVGDERSWHFNLDETEVLYRHHNPVSMEYHLPHDWHMSPTGYAVPLLLRMDRSRAHSSRSSTRS